MEIWETKIITKKLQQKINWYKIYKKIYITSADYYNNY